MSFTVEELGFCQKAIFYFHPLLDLGKIMYCIYQVIENQETK
jgi:hypothetical protein